ncbi:MAG TPA: four helix bundle protein [Terracidiphilus sp.]|jgi:four helix bundle protein|nr:four helix bundle protein [Terracidiphilus sp.]
MSRPKSYRDLIVWQKAMGLARQAYTLTAGLPKSEADGLLAQVRRAAVSIPSNIAEGHGRLTDLQFRYFLGNARGSLCELQTQVELAADLGYFDKQNIQAVVDQGAEVGRLLNGLISSLRQHSTSAETNTADSASAAQHGLRK